jgi:hypothetical protein
LLVRDNPAGFAVREAPPDRLHDVQVVQHVVEAAIVWETVEEFPNSIFGRHMNLGEDASSIRPAAPSSKLVISPIGPSLVGQRPAADGCKRLILIQPSPCSYSCE